MPPEIRAGSRVGPYLVLRQLGSGGFGQVWQANDPDGNRVAIKFLNAEYQGTTAARLRTDVELLAAAASAQSPHVVRVLSSGLEPVPHIVMEYVDGTDLAKEIARSGKLSTLQVLAVARAVGEALCVLEDQGIVHRDVKPANVLIDRDGVIKLADFGIAKIAGLDYASTTSQHPLSIAYSAPEVWDGEATHLSDLYALGVLLYQCYVGQPPFRGSYEQVYLQHKSAEPDWTKLPTDTPNSLAKLISSCLAKAPSARPTTARDALELVEAAENEVLRGPGTPLQANTTINLPRAFGPWIRRAYSDTRPWSFLCEHESTGARATVEVLFGPDLAFGQRLRDAVKANEALVTCGAERLLGTSRLILRPGENWPDTAAGKFQFWVAREEQPRPTTLGIVAAGSLVRAAQALRRLIEAAARNNMQLSLSPRDLALTGAAAVYLERPGLPPFDERPMQVQAMEWLGSLQLTAEARSLLERTPSLEQLSATNVTPSQPVRSRSAGPGRPEMEQPGPEKADGGRRGQRRGGRGPWVTPVFWLGFLLAAGIVIGAAALVLTKSGSSKQASSSASSDAPALYAIGDCASASGPVGCESQDAKYVVRKLVNLDSPPDSSQTAQGLVKRYCDASTVFAFYPNPGSFARGDHQLACLDTLTPGFGNTAPPPQPAATPASGLTAAGAVQQFYSYIGRQNYPAAFALLSSSFRGSVPLETWQKGYSSTVAVTNIDAETLPGSGDQVQVKFRSTDVVNGRNVVRDYSGIWTLVQEQGQWKLDKGQFSPPVPAP